MTGYAGHPDQHFGAVTYSQHGEDLMILNIFRLLGTANVSPLQWLDIGAHHPVNISNTKLLSTLGYSGVNVEANPLLIAAFNEDRPLDKNVAVGVGPVEGVSMLYMFDDRSGRNTFDHAEALRFSRESGREIRKTMSISLRTISQIVLEHCNGLYPPLLSLDIEGLDFEVLRSADFSLSRPSAICVEVRRGDSRIPNLLCERWGYFVYCRMGENLIFVHSDNRGLLYA